MGSRNGISFAEEGFSEKSLCKFGARVSVL